MVESGASDAVATTRRRRRPRRVTTISTVLMAFGVVGLLDAGVLLFVFTDAADHGRSIPLFLYGLCFLQFALSATQVVSGVFVWRGRSWARITAIVICAVNVLGAIAFIFFGAVPQGCLTMVVNIAIIGFLANNEVTNWCDGF
jgi:hypothetical protein